MATADETEVKQTDVAQVEENDDGVPSQVNEYKIGEFLGEGAYSKVYLCYKTVNFLRTNYALKILNKSFLKRKREIKMVNGRPVHSNAFNKVEKEVAIMKKLNHPNLTKLHEVIDDAEHDKMYLVLELVKGGQVMDWDQQAMLYNYMGAEEPAPASIVQTCMLDIALALEYLHANQICHRDIKPENVLRSNDSVHYKLSDFGVAHMFSEDDPSSNQLKNTEGTYHYLAPECTVGKAFDPFKVDVWALGVTMYAMLFRRLPFAHSPESMSGGALAIMECIREDALDFPTPDVDDDCVDILRRLMDKNPDTRITLAELKDHPWLHHAKQALLDQDEENAALAMRVSVVSISDSDINLAFTPVNNLLLMVKIKMKFGAKLREIRSSITDRKNSSSEDTVAQQDVPAASPVASLPTSSPVQLSMADISLDTPSVPVAAPSVPPPLKLSEPEEAQDVVHQVIGRPPSNEAIARSPAKRGRSLSDKFFQRQSSKSVDGKKQKDCQIM
ncbi:CAMKK protein kinase [Aphanomyces invadans]|uniref:CAMKK protein kinase n=1 Tax=Aphanomyces invadans TaxID=157072 RepID=A0A024U8M8_9STRA|nr:CAMKK protein kinase [Aphanomyces invadans]ETW02634.1 CAMKK protein kinase [Aphanomyces invadans]|eukprot:XP_008869239.1 CAMKK protein kinase [Aphanomyces invadans]